MLVEAAWHAARTPGPLRAFARADRRHAAARNIATVAVARKLAVIAWHMLSRGEDYAFARPSLAREKIRRLELRTGAERQQGRRTASSRLRNRSTGLETRSSLLQAELAYRRLVQDWQPAIKGAGAAPGRASSEPSSGKQRGRRQPHLLRS